MLTSVLYLQCWSFLLLLSLVSASGPLVANKYPLASASIPLGTRQRINNSRRESTSSSLLSSRNRVRSYREAPLSYINPVFLASADTRRKTRRRSSRRSLSSYDNNHLSVILASSKAAKSTISSSSSVQEGADAPTATYDDLTPLGRLVAGTVEVIFSTLLEFTTGFVGGYFLGSITGIPAWFSKPMQEEVRQSMMKELGQRTFRMHAKSMSWGKSWGGISAAFGGFRVLTKVVRGGEEDEWNTVISSMAAGAYFARKEGPQAMLKGALMYGALMYFLAGGLGGRKEPFEYQEKEIEF